MSDPEHDLSRLRPLARFIEKTRVEQAVPRMLMGGYLLGVAAGYLQAAGASDDKIRETLEELLEGD